jgi:hypothetical protein
VVTVEAARLVFGTQHQIYFYYSFEANVDALLIGCGLALRAMNRGSLPRFPGARLSLLLPIGGLVLCNFMSDALWPLLGATTAAWCSAILISRVVASPPRMLNNRIMDFLGALL